MARFTNQAQLQYGNVVANSNIAVGEILEVLAAAKTAVRKTYGQNDSITYIVSIVNSGTVTLNGITLADNLGEYEFNETTLAPLTYISNTVKYYVNGTLQPTPTVVTQSPLVISGISVPAGGNAILAYETAINEFAPLDTEAEIHNVVTVSGGGITPITASETIDAVSNPILTITKSLSPVPVTENGTLTYTFLVQNTGNVAATESASALITDTFNPILSNLSVSFNGAAWTEGEQYTYDEVTGEFATVAGQITVPEAAYTQDATTGAWFVNPGVSTLIVTGTV